MKPAQFAYHDPQTLDEAIALLQQYGGEAKILAGGQSLIPIMNMRLAKPKALIDLNKVPDLAYIREEGDTIAIGAMTRHSEVEKSALLARRQPLLVEAVRQVGHSQIRNRGTIGGSLAHADPAAELPAAMVCLDARFRIAGPNGEREVGADEFFVMYLTTCLEPEEILREVRVPVLPPSTGYAFVELARRSGDFALAGVACTLSLAPDGAVAGCRLALFGVDMKPVRATEAEAHLAGQAPSAAAFAEAARLAREGIMPDSDIHATAEYRQELAEVLTRRALELALSRAEGGDR